MKKWRHLFTAGVIVSLLLCAGFAAMWVRSRRAFDAWSRGDASGRGEMGVLSSRGRMMAWHVSVPPPEASRRFTHRVEPGFRHVTRRPISLQGFWLGGPQTDFNRAGFGYYSRDVHGAWWRCLFLPWWALCVITLLPPAVWVRVRFFPKRAAPDAAPADAPKPTG